MYYFVLFPQYNNNNTKVSCIKGVKKLMFGGKPRHNYYKCLLYHYGPTVSSCIDSILFNTNI